MSAASPVPDGTRARILAVATEQIRRLGLARFSVIHVARAAGMTHANIYRYFESKAALTGEIAAEWLRGLEQRLAEITQAPDPAYDKLERFLTLLARAYEDKARNDPEVFAIMADGTGPDSDRHGQRVRALLGHIIEEGAATRTFAATEARRTEQLILDTMHRFIDAATVRRAVSQDPGRSSGWESRRERVTRLLVRGLSQQRD